MPGEERRQRSVLMVVNLEQRIPREPPLRGIKQVSEAALKELPPTSRSRQAGKDVNHGVGASSFAGAPQGVPDGPLLDGVTAFVSSASETRVRRAAASFCAPCSTALESTSFFVDPRFAPRNGLINR